MRDTAFGIITSCTPLGMIKWAAPQDSPSTSRGNLRCRHSRVSRRARQTARTGRAYSGRLDLQGEGNQRPEALSRLGRLELSTTALRWRGPVRVLPKARILELAPIRPGHMSGEPCLSILRTHERKSAQAFSHEGYTTCVVSISFLPGKKKMFHDAHL
jgi:hypothetical protein